MRLSQPQKPHMKRRISISPPAPDTQKNTPKPESVVASQRRSASCATAARRNIVEALQQALEALGLPEALVAEIEERLRSQHTLLGKIFGLIFPSLLGCRTSSELRRAHGQIKRLRRLGLEVLAPLWRDAASKSASARSHRQWT